MVIMVPALVVTTLAGAAGVGNLDLTIRAESAGVGDGHHYGSQQWRLHCCGGGQRPPP